MNPSNYNKSIAAADKVLAEFYIQSPSDIYSVDDIIGISEFLNVHVRTDNLSNCVAKISIDNSQAVITYDVNMTSQPRIKFSIAHELGHYLLHHYDREQKTFRDTPQDFMRKGRRRGIEQEADSFASELLLPTSLFTKAIRESEIQEPNFNLVNEIATKFNMSMTATAIRLVTSGPYCCALVVTEDQIVKWYSADDQFPHKFGNRVGKPVPEDSAAREAYQNEISPDSTDLMQADVWFSRSSHTEMIVEHAFYIKSYNMCLSLIWNQGDII